MQDTPDKIKLLITIPFSKDLINRIRDVSDRLDIEVIKATSTSEIPDEVWKEVEILYTNYVIPERDQAPELKWIQVHWAGVNHISDKTILNDPDIVLTTLSGAAVPQISEYVLMMILALGHRLPGLFKSQAKAEWSKDKWKRFAPQELNSSTVGIVGYGSIGRQVARLLHGFGAEVLAVKRDNMSVMDEGFYPDDMGDPEGVYVKRIYPTQALKSMVRECDFVVVAVPLTDETYGMINAEVFKEFKETAYLIDISRGGVVDHDALINALEEGMLGGAALDVFPSEPLPADSPLWKMDNVIITPHISGSTPYYDDRAVALFVANLRRYTAGESLFNLFKRYRGY